MNFGEKLQQLRKEKGLSQEQLAAQVTVSRQAISKWELGESMPDSDNVVQLSELFGVSTDFLLKDDVENTEELSNTTSARTSVPVTAFGVILIGLVVAFVGWRTWQTLIPVGAGFALQLMGCVLYEAFYIPNVPKRQAKNTRKKHYAAGLWGLLPIPVCMLVSGLFSLYPGPFYTLLRTICSLFAYFLVALAMTFVLKKK